MRALRSHCWRYLLTNSRLHEAPDFRRDWAKWFPYDYDPGFPPRSPVFVVEADTELRETLRDLLEDDGYAVLEAGNPNEALALLCALPTSVVLIVSNAEWSGRRELTFFTAIAAAPVLAAQHAYIYLTTTPERTLPVRIAILERLGAPILAKPFEIRTWGRYRSRSRHDTGI